MAHKAWTARWSTDETNAFCSYMAKEHLDKIPPDRRTEEVVRLRSLVESDDFVALVAYKLHATGFACADDLAHAYQALSFFTKRADLELGIDKRAAARRSFLKAECRNSMTNDLLRLRSDGRFQFVPRVERVIQHAQRQIAEILGPVPSPGDLAYRFGPGATTRVTKRESNPRRKLGAGFQCTRELIEGCPWLPSELYSWFKHHACLTTEIDNSLVSYVPKNAKTDRVIAVEPVLNSMAQLAVGDYMAMRLRRVGLDIRDQQLNQELAKSGSITGQLATLDLSSASDLISTLLVMELLPWDWFCFLDSMRSHRAEFEGKTMRLEKFSSMGNGFTFPLETLIFYTLAVGSVKVFSDGNTVIDNRVRAYGDDLIISTSVAPLLTEVLEAVGFEVNVDKSFSSGPFRESCGKDYFLGIDVRPWFAKDVFSDASLYALVNHYVRRGMLDFAVLAATVVEGPLLEGPDGFGDGHLVSDKPLAPHGRDRGYCGYTFRTQRFSPRRELFGVTTDVDMAYALYWIYRSPQKGNGISWTRQMSVYRKGGLYRRRVSERSGESTAHPVGIDGTFSVSLTGVREDIWDGASLSAYDIVRVYTLNLPEPV